jgi:hypothetical protein
VKGVSSASDPTVLGMSCCVDLLSSAALADMSPAQVVERSVDRCPARRADHRDQSSRNHSTNQPINQSINQINSCHTCVGWWCFVVDGALAIASPGVAGA